MTTDFLRQRVQRLLEQAGEALDRLDWDDVKARAEAILRLDPENEDAKGLLTAASSNATANSAPTSAPLSSAAASPAPTSFANGRYTVSKFLGEGGKKKVYLAHDALLDRDVAFALIKTEGLDEASRTRITREEVLETSTGAIIIDYKTGKIENTDLLDVEDQLHFYAGLWAEIRGRFPVEGRANFLVDGRSHSVQISQSYARRLMNEAREVATSLSTARWLEMAAPGPHCRTCEYRPWCEPYWAVNQESTEAIDEHQSDLEGLICSVHPRDSKTLCISTAEHHVTVVNRDELPLPEWPNGTRVRMLDLGEAGSTRFKFRRTEMFLIQG